MTLDALARAVPSDAEPQVRGAVVELTGAVVRAIAPGVAAGELVELRASARPTLLAEVVGFRGDEAVLAPLGSTVGLSPGAAAVPTGRRLEIEAGPALLGRVLGGLGEPADGGPPVRGERWAVDRDPPPALARPPLSRPLALGVRALDGLLTVAEGQRLGLFAAAGAGKSTLLARVAAGAAADVLVVALVGERGREVGELLARGLGPEARARAVVVAATSDRPAAVRAQALPVATAIAEWFAERQGARVLLLCDSLTRHARALREVALAAGEPPARHGYPASVFAALPRVLERAGARARGAVTAVHTVLVAGDDHDEPVADEVRGLLDGHVVLDRGLAEAGHHPAIDVLRSVSRAMPAVAEPGHLALAVRLRALLAARQRVRDLLAVGAYRPGADPAADEALARGPRIDAYLQQPTGRATSLAEAVDGLRAVLG